MDDPLIDALTGGAVSPDDVDGARRHLVMLRSLVEEVRGSWPSLVPDAPGRWRSTAAAGYGVQLEELRTTLAEATVALAEAEAALEACLRDLDRRLEAQAASAAAAAGPR